MKYRYTLKINLIFSILSILFLSNFFVGCSKKNDLKELKLTYVKAPLNVPTIVEYKDRAFEKEFSKDGIKVEFVNLTTGPQQLQGIASGEVTIGHGIGAMSVILAASNDMPVVILNAYSRSPKSFMLVSNKTDNTNLKGYKIAGPKGTILHQLLLSILEKQGLTDKDIEFINMGLSESAAALANGSVDAALLAGVVAFNELKNGKTLISTGEGLIDALVVSVTTKKFLEENPEIIKRFIKTHKDSLKYISENEELSLGYVAEELKIPLEDAKIQFKNYDFSSEITQKDLMELEKTQEFLLKNNLQTKPVDLKSIIYPDSIKK